MSKYKLTAENIATSVAIAKRQQFVDEPKGSAHECGMWMPTAEEWQPCCTEAFRDLSERFQEHCESNAHIAHTHGIPERTVKMLADRLWALIDVENYENYKRVGEQIDEAADVLAACDFDTEKARYYLDAGVTAADVPHWETLRAQGADLPAILSTRATATP